MKKTGALALALVFLALAPLMASAASLGAGSARVFDYAGLMTAGEVSGLEKQISELRAQYGMDIVVLTSYEAKTDASLAFADDFFDYNVFGQGADRDGFLFFIDMHNRVPTISTSGLMIRYITDDRLSALLDAGYDYLAKGKYASAVTVTLGLLKTYLGQGIPSGQYNYDEYGSRDYYDPKSLPLGEMAAALSAGELAALVFVSVVRHRYGLKGSTYKYDLHANTDVTITGAQDEYLRTTVTRTRRQSSSSGGGGGFGSSTHRSSSGRTHGGGSGRRF